MLKLTTLFLQYDNFGAFAGYDLRDGDQVAWQEAEGKYATDLFNDRAVNVIMEHDGEERPLFLYLAHLATHTGNGGKLLEAPQQDISKFRHIIDPNRRTYAAMVWKLDEGVGRIVDALRERDMLKDSIIIFMSDNGAPSVVNRTTPMRPNWGSNYPFRGSKNTLWEGGVRSPGLIWAPQLQKRPRISKELMHISDWLPTLYTAAGGNAINLASNLDGVDQWYALTLNLPTRVRTSVLLNIDEINRNAAIRAEHWKLILGTFDNGNSDGYYGDFTDGQDAASMTYNVTAVLTSPAAVALEEMAESLRLPTLSGAEAEAARSLAGVGCDAQSPLPGMSLDGDACRITPCLFNVVADPCERVDVAKRYAPVTARLYDILTFYRFGLVPQINQPPDALRANPKLWNNTWSPWL